jgi:hypothetical protein
MVHAGVALRPVVAVAQAQYFFIQTSNPITPDQTSTTIEVWAAFDRDFYAMDGSHFEVFSSPDGGAFAEPRFPEPFMGDKGMISPDGDSVSAILSWQLDYGGEAFADTSDPIKIWECTWRTDDFTPRRVDVNLLASDFYVYVDKYRHGAPPFDPRALGYVNVVPVPGAGILLLLAGARSTRRRRAHPPRRRASKV